jgi:NitT/TauT family transport system ATP-binding protein
MANQIIISALQKSFLHEGQRKVVLDNISFSIEAEKLTTIIGPSGCGKSTLLNIIAGIEPYESGHIDFAIEERAPRVGYVFQTPRLLPWLNILDNMLFVKPDNVSKTHFLETAKYYLNMVGLGDEMRKYPLQLSGGMQQRVGIARALVIEPDILLMDEPFSHLDEITAEKMRSHLIEIFQKTRKSILFVTHDIHEATQLGDRMLIFTNKGTLVDDIPVVLKRPRDLKDKAFLEFYNKVVKRFSELQQEASQDDVAVA